MSPRRDFLLNFFSDRFILLKENWLNTCIDYLENQGSRARTLSDEKFADLVFDQWTCSNIGSTSFPTFGNHGINESAPKFQLQGPIVCQVNSFIDTGSPYYAQFTSLSGTTKVDRTGFDQVFHEKEDDYDKKPSRLLKLCLTDGETTLKAIEFWKCPQLSLYCKPGVKILIRPPCLIRKGTFLLKPNNCKLLGGQVLPSLNCNRPLDQYVKMLGIKNFKSDSASASTTTTANTGNTGNDDSDYDWDDHPSISYSAGPSTSSASAPGPSRSPYFSSTPSTSSAAPVRVPPGPTPLLAKYLNKPSSSTPSTSRVDSREISPDIFDDDDEIDEFADFKDNDEWENPNLFDKTLQPSTSRAAEVTPHTLLRRRNVDMEIEDFETRKTTKTTPKTPKSPLKRKSMQIIQSPPFTTSRSSGILTSRRSDPQADLLEDMIEEGEEPVKSQDKPKKTTPNPFRRRSPIRKSPPKSPKYKKIKVEEDSDDDIQIIEITPPVKKEVKEGIKKKVEEKENLKEDEKMEEDMDPEEKEALEAFSKLKLSTFEEAKKRMKFSIGSRRFTILAFIENIPEPLRVVDNMWTMKVEMMDESGKTDALIDNSTLVNLIGYTCQEAIAIRNSSDMEKRQDGKRRLDALQDQLHRLDLVFEMEFFAGSTSSIPVIRSMKTLAEQIDVF